MSKNASAANRQAAKVLEAIESTPEGVIQEAYTEGTRGTYPRLYIEVALVPEDNDD